MEATRERLIYLAGLFDGEGSFSIQVKVKEHKGVKRVAFTPKMSMTLYYGHEVLRLLHEAFGGSIYKYANGTHRWNLGNRQGVLQAAEVLRSHLVIKQKICVRYLEALSMFPPIVQHQWQGKRSWTNDIVLKVAKIALTINSSVSNENRTQCRSTSIYKDHLR